MGKGQEELSVAPTLPGRAPVPFFIPPGAPSTLLSGAVVALLVLVGAPPLTAQSGPALGPGNEVGAALSLRPAISHAAGKALSLLGVGAAIRVSPRMEVGGEGVFGFNQVRVSAFGSPDHLDLTLGYGGLHLRYHPDGLEGATGWSGGLLVGAGAARVHSALANAEVGSDNFAVIEASLSHLWRLGRGFRGGVAGAYRVVAALDPLPGMEDEGLSGLSLSLVLYLARDP